METLDCLTRMPMVMTYYCDVVMTYYCDVLLACMRGTVVYSCSERVRMVNQLIKSLGVGYARSGVR